MRVKEIRNAELRKRVEQEQAFICQKEFNSDTPIIKMMNEKGEGALIDGDGFIMLPKNKTIQLNEKIGPPEDMVLPSTVLEHLIRNASHRVIINFCLCRDGMKCQDYPIEFGCIFLGDAAKKISPELGRAATVEETLEYARRCREAGLVHMVGRFSSDLRWLNEGVGPITKLVTVCNCCPCCCGMRILPHLRDDLRNRVLSPMPGVEVTVTEDCTGCGLCQEQCMFQAIQVKEGMAEIDVELCRICGRCADVCPSGAIGIMVKDPGYVQKAIQIISDKINYT